MRITRGNRRVRSARERWSALGSGIRRVAVRRGKAVLVAAGVVAVTWTVVGGYRVLRESDHFRLRQVAVEGNRATSPDEVIRTCELRLGEDHLLFTSASEIEERCESDPRWRHVDVTIEMPDRVVVRVEEQDTLLYAATPGGLWKVNRYGEAWAPADPGDLLAAPLLVGAEAVMTDPERSRAILRDTLSLVRTVTGGNSGEGLGGGPFDGHGLILSWDEVLGFTVHDTTSGFRARFGHAPFGLKFSRLVRALDEARRRGLSVEQALVDNESTPEAVTLRLAPASGPAMAAGVAGTGARGIATQSQEAVR